LNGAQVDFVLPKGTTYVGVNNHKWTVSNSDVIHTLGRLASGDEVGFEITAQLSVEADHAGELTAGASLVSGTALPVTANPAITIVETGRGK
jgi:hypothetical protein